MFIFWHFRPKIIVVIYMLGQSKNANVADYKMKILLKPSLLINCYTLKMYLQCVNSYLTWCLDLRNNCHGLIKSGEICDFK